MRIIFLTPKVPTDPRVFWNATNTDDVVETFICSSMIIPSAMLAQCLPLLMHMLLGPSFPGLQVLSTLGEMAGWAGPVIAIFASPNIESTWIIVAVCFALAMTLARCVVACASPTTVDGLHMKPWTAAASVDVTSVSVTYTRISSLLFTVLGIFCVDFPNFGERFMKSETIGLTLMDIGIGCSLFSSGVSEGLRRRRVGLGERLLWQMTPTLIIGLFRTGILYSIGYRVEITEYGRHWNAFITFAAMPLLVSILQLLMPTRWLRWGYLASVIAILVPYNGWLLQHTNYLMFDEQQRVGLIEANKEGIASVLGFFAIYAMGILFAPTLTEGKRWSRVSVEQAVALLLCALAFSMDQGFITWMVPQAFSRRIANTPYILYCVGMNAFFMKLLIEMNRMFLPTVWAMQRTTSTSRKHPTIGYYTHQVNIHQLLYFVLANILTGVINLVWTTHNFTDFESYFVQAGYVAFLGAIILPMPSFRSKTKKMHVQ